MEALNTFSEEISKEIYDRISPLISKGISSEIFGKMLEAF